MSNDWGGCVHGWQVTLPGAVARRHRVVGQGDRRSPGSGI